MESRCRWLVCEQGKGRGVFSPRNFVGGAASVGACGVEPAFDRGEVGVHLFLLEGKVCIVVTAGE